MCAWFKKRGSLTGVVTDAATNKPVSGVKVKVAGRSTKTAGDGKYSIGGINPGGYSVTFSKSGYQNLVK